MLLDPLAARTRASSDAVQLGLAAGPATLIAVRMEPSTLVYTSTLRRVSYAHFRIGIIDPRHITVAVGVLGD